MNDTGPRQPLIRIHPDGQWTADGAPVRHPKVFRLFHESLERLPDGAYLIRVNSETCPVVVDDHPFLVTRLWWELTDDGDTFHLILNTGDEEILDPSGLRTDGGLFCTIRRGRLTARFSRLALTQMAPYLEMENDHAAFLVTSTGRMPIPGP